MEDLNQFAISKILGSKITRIESVGFGGFSELSTTEEIQKALRGERQSVQSPDFDYEQDASSFRHSRIFVKAPLPMSCSGTRSLPVPLPRSVGNWAWMHRIPTSFVGSSTCGRTPRDIVSVAS